MSTHSSALQLLLSAIQLVVAEEAHTRPSTQEEHTAYSDSATKLVLAFLEQQRLLVCCLHRNSHIASDGIFQHGIMLSLLEALCFLAPFNVSQDTLVIETLCHLIRAFVCALSFLACVSRSSVDPASASATHKAAPHAHCCLLSLSRLLDRP